MIDYVSKESWQISSKAYTGAIFGIHFSTWSILLLGKENTKLNFRWCTVDCKWSSDTSISGLMMAFCIIYRMIVVFQVIFKYFEYNIMCLIFVCFPSIRLNWIKNPCYNYNAKKIVRTINIYSYISTLPEKD